MGIRPGDLVLVTYALGLSNGGMAPREALWRYTGAIPVMAGSGATTPTRRQVELIKAWKINVILGFPAYLRHMALVARDEMGIDVRTLGVRLIGTHLGREDRRQIEQLWDAPCFDMYGTHESGMMGAECPGASKRTTSEHHCNGRIVLPPSFYGSRCQAPSYWLQRFQISPWFLS